MVSLWMDQGNVVTVVNNRPDDVDRFKLVGNLFLIPALIFSTDLLHLIDRARKL
jgi:hypothetical protein